VSTLYRAVKPDPAALEFASRVACLTTLAEAIRAKLNPNPPDISQVMGRSTACSTNPSPATKSANPGRRRSTCRRSTSRRWRRRFKESKHKNTDLEVLKAAIRAQLEKMIQLNRTRADFAEKFEALIESYNAGSRSIEELLIIHDDDQALDDLAFRYAMAASQSFDGQVGARTDPQIEGAPAIAVLAGMRAMGAVGGLSLSGGLGRIGLRRLRDAATGLCARSDVTLG
jgi:hypothetical protein